MGSDAVASKEAEPCPFLVPVMADRLWLYPVGAYCRRPDGRVRIAAPTTLTCICMTPAHLVCSGYLDNVHHLAAQVAAPA